MKLNIYSIYDVKIAAFSQPYYSHTNGSALRAFADHVNDPQSQPNKHPEDYQLFHLGSFDDNTGEILATKPAPIGTAAEYLKEK